MSAVGRKGTSDVATVSAESVQRVFYPPVLEIQQTPPSPLGRWLLRTVLLLFSLGMVWAVCGKVDIVVSAHGRVMPEGRVKVIQPLEPGRITAIHVRDGQEVRKGAPLVSLDATNAEADRAIIAGRLSAASSEFKWRSELATRIETVRPQCDGQSGSPDTPVGLDDDEFALLAHHCRELQARLEAIEKQRRVAETDLAAAAAEQSRTVASLAILRDRVAAYRDLYNKQFGSRVSYLEMQQQQVDMEGSLPVLEMRKASLEERLEVLDAQYRAAVEEARRDNASRARDLREQIDTLEQEMRKASLKSRELVITAPVQGTVEQLAVHTVGGVVTPAQELMRIVPRDDTLAVELLLNNRDAGFVREGQSAVVKFDAFDFGRYGGLKAIVKDVGEDAVASESLGWAFPVRLQLLERRFRVGERWASISPGMTVVAEMKTGRRRVIDFFLSPLVEVANASLKER